MNVADLVIYFPARTSSVCKNVIDFCVLILNPATLLKSLVSSSSLCEVFWFPNIKNHVIYNCNNFTSSFPFCISLISFPFLMDLVKTSTAILNNIGVNVLPCLLLALIGKASNSSPFDYTYCGFFIHYLYCVEVYSIYIIFFRFLS